LHQNQGLQQSIGGHPWLETLARRERGKSSADPFCMTLRFIIVIVELMIKMSGDPSTGRYQNGYLRK
jgi:hypothetical protein